MLKSVLGLACNRSVLAFRQKCSKVFVINITAYFSNALRDAADASLERHNVMLLSEICKVPHLFVRDTSIILKVFRMARLERADAGIGVWNFNGSNADNDGAMTHDSRRPVRKAAGKKI